MNTLWYNLYCSVAFGYSWAAAAVSCFLPFREVLLMLTRQKATTLILSLKKKIQPRFESSMLALDLSCMCPVTFILGFCKQFIFIQLRHGRSVMWVPEMPTPFSSSCVWNFLQNQSSKSVVSRFDSFSVFICCPYLSWLTNKGQALSCSTTQLVLLHSTHELGNLIYWSEKNISKF